MTNPAYVQSKIESEERLYQYRSKLRRKQCTNHIANIRSECAQCRAEFWKDCQKLMKQEISTGIGLVNTIKSEAAAPSSRIN